MERLLLIMLGGAVGTGARYGVGVLAKSSIGEHLPWGTFLVNLLGCFFMAAVTEAFAGGALKSEDVRLAVTTGFLGGFTTYSAFNLETTLLWQRSGPAVGMGYFAATAVGCLLMGLLGSLAARRLLL